jgi:hypothetical protein
MAPGRQAGERQPRGRIDHAEPFAYGSLAAIVVEGSDPAAGSGRGTGWRRLSALYVCELAGAACRHTTGKGASEAGARWPALKGRRRRVRPRLRPAGGLDSGAQGCARSRADRKGLNLVSAVRAPNNGLWMVMLAVAVGLAGLARSVKPKCWRLAACQWASNCSADRCGPTGAPLFEP